jgi:hypothetical protein
VAKHRADTTDLVHLQAPQTTENEGANIFCPVQKEFTRIFLGHSADGMEVYACASCYEPEPRIADVTDEELNAIYRQLYDNA